MPEGEPVAGATVRQSGDGPVPTETETDANGHFRLPGVLAEPAFVFVEKKGYRFAGRSIGADSAPVDLTLERADGPPASPLTTLPPALSRDQERKLLRLIFDPYAERVLNGKKSNERLRGLQDPHSARARAGPRDPRSQEARRRLPSRRGGDRNFSNKAMTMCST